jgi:hypothetical protein
MFGVTILRVQCYKWQNREATAIGVLRLQFSRAFSMTSRLQRVRRHGSDERRDMEGNDNMQHGADRDQGAWRVWTRCR